MAFHIMSRVARKPVFEVSDQVRYKQGCTATEDGKRLENSDIGSRVDVLSMYVAETAQLICTFVFACAKKSFLMMWHQ